MKYNLSEINEIIRNRRTIYPEQFSEREVHKEIIQTLLENARWAPTHKLTQPWYFKVFIGEGRKKLAEFQSEKYKENTPESDFNEMKYRKLNTRPLLASAIIAVGMKRDPEERLPEIEEIIAVACGVQNILLTATAYGLGVFWSTGGLTFTGEMKQFLKLDKKDQCLGFLYLGYPKVEWPKSRRRPQEYYTDWVEE